MKLADFDYDLPEEMIAQFPSEKRDTSRLLVLDRNNSRIDHERFFQVADHINSGDALVINDTKVFPARLFGKKETGGRAEVLLLEKVRAEECSGDGFAEEWKCIMNVAKPPKTGSRVYFDDAFWAEIVSRKEEIYSVILRSKEDMRETIHRKGFTPLPPYIRRTDPDEFEKMDRERYQAIYARESGAVAAPTAGLHFTEGLLAKMREKGVEVIPLTLHIGLATFNPVRAEDIEEHAMHHEYCRIGTEAAERINGIRIQGGKICAVGTTVVRTLEYFGDSTGNVQAGEGMNDLFIYPGYRFKVVDRLITNFHLPKSTLLMLVSAFAGKENIFKAYREAIERKYRFYSYGDAMLII